MAKQQKKIMFWTIVVILMIGIIAIGYCTVVAHALNVQFKQELKKFEKQEEVIIIHEYEEGYNDGYAKGKVQAIEDVLNNNNNNN